MGAKPSKEKRSTHRDDSLSASATLTQGNTAQRAKSVEKSVGEETEEGNDAERAQADTNPGQSPDRARDCFSVPAYERDHALVLDLMEFFCYGIKPDPNFFGTMTFVFDQECDSDDEGGDADGDDEGKMERGPMPQLEVSVTIEKDATVVIPGREKPRPRVVVTLGKPDVGADPAKGRVRVPYKYFLLIYSGKASAKDVVRLAMRRNIELTGFAAFMQFGLSFDYSSHSWEGYYELKAESREYRRRQRALQQQQPDGTHDAAAAPEQRGEVRHVEPPPHHGQLPQEQHGQESTSSGSGLVMPHPSVLLTPPVAVACDSIAVGAGNNIGEDVRLEKCTPVEAGGTNSANNVLFSSDHFKVGAEGKLLAGGGGARQKPPPDDLTSQNGSNATSDNRIGATSNKAGNNNAEETSTGAAAPVRRIRDWLRNIRGRGGGGGDGSGEGTHGVGQSGVKSAGSTPNATGAGASNTNKRDGLEKPVWFTAPAVLPVPVGGDDGGVLGYHHWYGCSASLVSALEGLLLAWNRHHTARGGLLLPHTDEQGCGTFSDRGVDQLLPMRWQERGSALSHTRWLFQPPGMCIGRWTSWSGCVTHEHATKCMRVGSDPAQQRRGQRYDYWNGKRMQYNPGTSDRVLCDNHLPRMRSSWHRCGRHLHRRAPTTAPSPSVAAAVVQPRPPSRYNYLHKQGHHHPRKQAASSSKNSDEVAAVAAVTAAAAPCVLASARHLGQYGPGFGAAAAAAAAAAAGAAAAAAVGRGVRGP